MPPETFSAEGYYSEGTNPMVDAWALGCVLYFCFYGKPPFYGDPTQVKMLLISSSTATNSV